MIMNSAVIAVGKILKVLFNKNLVKPYRSNEKGIK